MNVHLPPEEEKCWSSPLSPPQTHSRSSSHSKKELRSPSEANGNNESHSPIIPVLTEFVYGYRKPAILTDAQGSVICMNAAAGRMFDKLSASTSKLSDRVNTPIDLQEWEHKAHIQADGHSLYLIIPACEEPSGSPQNPTNIQLPPRLAKIARLVISGCTDKQIAVHTGLSFSTVRTYVRQIYRRIGVHSRIELVHATNHSRAIQSSNDP